MIWRKNVSSVLLRSPLLDLRNYMYAKSWQKKRCKPKFRVCTWTITICMPDMMMSCGLKCETCQKSCLIFHDISHVVWLFLERRGCKIFLLPSVVIIHSSSSLVPKKCLFSWKNIFVLGIFCWFVEICSISIEIEKN